MALSFRLRRVGSETQESWIWDSGELDLGLRRVGSETQWR